MRRSAGTTVSTSSRARRARRGGRGRGLATHGKRDHGHFGRVSDLLRAVDACHATRGEQAVFSRSRIETKGLRTLNPHCRIERRPQEGEMDRKELLRRRDVTQAERVGKEASGLSRHERVNRAG